jgi:hypothetical protein
MEWDPFDRKPTLSECAAHSGASPRFVHIPRVNLLSGSERFDAALGDRRSMPSGMLSAQNAIGFPKTRTLAAVENTLSKLHAVLPSMSVLNGFAGGSIRLVTAQPYELTLDRSGCTSSCWSPR